MNQVVKGFLLALLGASAAYPARLWADLAWTEQTATLVVVDGKPSPQGVVQTKISLKGNAAKFEDLSQNGVRYYNFANQSAIFLSLKNKSFLTVRFADLLAQARAQEGQVRQDLDAREAAANRSLNLTSGKITKAQVQGQRKRFALAGQPFRLEETKQTKTLLGHPCRLYRGYAGKDNYLEVWAAEDVKPDPAFRAYAEAFARLDPVGSQHLLSVPGFPLLATFRYGPVQVDWSVQSLSLAPLPLEEFLLPPGARPAMP